MENSQGKSDWYQKNYKKLLIIPAIILIASLVYIFIFFQQTGDFINRDVSLTGGTTITVFDSNVDKDSVISALEEEFPDIKARAVSDIRSGRQLGFFIETKADAEPARKALEDFLGYELDNENSSIEFSGATLSAGFYKQLQLAVLIAFILMAIVVFFIFKTFVPSLAVVLAAFSDIIMTLAFVNWLGWDLSAAGIVAFLMLIGYSVDTDVLLTSRLLKHHEGNVNSRLKETFKTGMTMTLTSITAVGVSLFIIWNISDVLRQIFGILFIGLIFDMVNTWTANASILKWYMEAKKLE